LGKNDRGLGVFLEVFVLGDHEWLGFNLYHVSQLEGHDIWEKLKAEAQGEGKIINVQG
jgi:hypothetical protein